VNVIGTHFSALLRPARSLEDQIPFEVAAMIGCVPP
jgi:hypothetical protein